MESIKSVNPATGEVIGDYDLDSGYIVENKVRWSADSFADWKNTSAFDRSVYINAVASVLKERKQELALIITTEMGKPMRESEQEIDDCIDLCEYFSANVETFLAAEFVDTDAITSGFLYEPLGTILSITPWNFPFWQAFSTGIPALAAGNVVLLKNSSYVPMCSMEIEKVFSQAGFPGGTYQTLLVKGSMVAGLIAREEVKVVSFTGSSETGKKVAAESGRYMKKFVLELGGSDPFIVLEDADVEMAAREAVRARFLNAGQSCTAAKRILVDESIAEEFTGIFLERTQELKVDDPTDPGTDIGPIVSAQQMEKLQRQVDETLSMGAEALIDGGPRAGEGFFFMPTVLTKVKESAPVMQEETFGPVAPIIAFTDEREAVNVANNTKFGLGASVWSDDRDRAMRIIRNIQAGFITINHIVEEDPRLPFGGYKESGVGRGLYRTGMQDFMQIKSLKVY